MPKQPIKKSATKSQNTRRLKAKPYKSFRLSKRIKHTKPVKGAFKLFSASLRFLRLNWKLFGGIVAIYLLLTVVIVKGLGISVGTEELKSALEEVFTGKSGALLSSVTLYGVLLSSTSSASNDVANVYQTILVLITSLAFIWALRQTFAKNKTSVRQSFYKGMYPMVPFLLVLLAIGLQLLPMLAGSWLYATVLVGGLAITALEKALWILIIALLALLSLYMVTSSVFALYISTLPDMTPMAALRSARELVRHRRWMVMRKVILLPIILIVVGGLIMVPIIILATPLAEWIYFGLSMISLAVVHAYMYYLYRELL